MKYRVAHRSEMEITSAMVIATMTPVFNEEFVDEPPLTGMMGSAELGNVI
jgi:hypothetical protein